MKKIILTTFLLAGLSLSASGKKNDSSGYPEGIKSYENLFYKGMKKGVAGFRIPALVTAKNGTLVAAIDERVPSLADLIGSRDINISVRLSTNQGKTWSKPKIAVSFPDGKSASDPSMIVDGKTGEIFLFYNYMDLDKAKGVFKLHYVKSKDNGKNWSKPVDITDQIAKPEWEKDFKFITSGRGIYTSDGKMLHTLVNLKRGLHIFGSDDHGETWYCIDTAITPADESKIVELSDGRLMVNSRVNSSAKRRYIHISEDKGKTWISHQDDALIDASCNASIIRYTAKRDGYDKDRLLFSNASSESGRKNLTVRLSYDEGETWPVSKVIYPGAAAYSSMTVLKNGDIAVFFEKDGYKSNEVVIFTLDWLTDGEDKVVKSQPEDDSKK